MCEVNVKSLMKIAALTLVGGAGVFTYIGMVSELLDGRLMEVARVALEASGNVVGVLHASKGLLDGGSEASLAEFEALLFAIIVDVLNPVVVVVGLGLVDAVLELDDVRVGNDVSVDRAEDGGRALVDGLGAESRLSDSRHGKGEDGLHDDGGDAGASAGGNVVLVMVIVMCVQAAQTPDVGLPATQTQNEMQGHSGKATESEFVPQPDEYRQLEMDGRWTGRRWKEEKEEGESEDDEARFGEVDKVSRGRAGGGARQCEAQRQQQRPDSNVSRWRQ